MEMQRKNITFQRTNDSIHYFLSFHNMFSHLADLRFTITIQTGRSQLLLDRHAIVKFLEIKERTKYVNEIYLQIVPGIEKNNSDKIRLCFLSIPFICI